MTRPTVSDRTSAGPFPRRPPLVPSEDVRATVGHSPLARWWSVDVFFCGFMAATCVLLLLFSDRIPHAGLLAGVHAATIGVYWLLKLAARKTTFFRVAYYLAPYPLILGLFEAMGRIIGPLRAQVLEGRRVDAALAHLDVRLFGVDPTRALDVILNPVSASILQFCYAFYYFAPAIVIFLLWWRRRYRTLLTTIGIIAGCWLSTYVGYYLFPAAGPRSFNHYEHALPLPGLAGWIHRTIDALEHLKLDAFPSGHTAISLLCLVLIFRESRRIGYLVLPAILGLILSTVALRYHYGVDVLAGGLFALFWATVGAKAVRRFDAR